MILFISFWLARALVALIVLLGIFALAVLINVPNIVRQARCPHDSGVSETNACDAICRKCGKNLGFISAWRAKRKEGAA